MVIASKMPAQDADKEELIAATTLFSLNGAEDTRKELQDSLLGISLDFLLIMTEGKDNSNKFMIICPIDGIGYIACISAIKEDIAVIKMNMKNASKEILQILTAEETEVNMTSDRNVIEKIQSKKENNDDKYTNIISKIEALKKIKDTTSMEIPKPNYYNSNNKNNNPQVPQPSQNTFYDIQRNKNYEVKFMTKNQIIFTTKINASSNQDAMERCKELYQNYKIEQFLEVNEYIDKLTF
ncbi:MAG: hypothetical protein GF329_00820 [Candidatus Lokiarchaeota archaeon]|nr:hypothetical protein [Candidatus Lokiarchaeota archaeon]